MTAMQCRNALNASTALESLLIRPISKSSAQQRAGRAGREVRSASKYGPNRRS
jgi:HrpA-like RNA helicase